MNIIKKITVNGWVAIASAVMMLIGLIMSAVSATSAYSINTIAGVIACAVIGIVGCGAVIFLSIKGFNRLFIDIINLVVVIMAAVAMVLMITGRANLIGFMWFSDLMSGNPRADFAMNTTIVAWVFYVLTVIVQAVFGFLKFSEKAN